MAKYGGVPPYRETRAYLQLVAAQLRKSNAESARHQAARQKEKKETKTAEDSDEHHLRQIVEPDGTVRYVTR